jgi:hypothetical protein
VSRLNIEHLIFFTLGQYIAFTSAADAQLFERCLLAWGVLRLSLIKIEFLFIFLVSAILAIPGRVTLKFVQKDVFLLALRAKVGTRLYRLGDFLPLLFLCAWS